MEKQYRTNYPSDVSDEEWVFVAPYLTLCREDAPQREHSLRAVFNGLRYIVRTGNQWRFMPGDLPPWTAVYQQTRRWMRAGVFEILVEDVRSLLREFAGRKPQPTAMIVDSRTLQSTPESGARAGYDGAKRRKGSKVHAAVDTFAWTARFRRLARDYERLNQSLAGYHYFAFAWIMLAQLTKLLNKSA
jgi:transposase